MLRLHPQLRVIPLGAVDGEAMVVGAHRPPPDLMGPVCAGVWQLHDYTARMTCVPAYQWKRLHPHGPAILLRRGRSRRWRVVQIRHRLLPGDYAGPGYGPFAKRAGRSRLGDQAQLLQDLDAIVESDLLGDQAVFDLEDGDAGEAHRLAAAGRQRTDR